MAICIGRCDSLETEVSCIAVDLPSPIGPWNLPALTPMEPAHPDRGPESSENNPLPLVFLTSEETQHNYWYYIRSIPYEYCRVKDENKPKLQKLWQPGVN